MFVSDKKCPRCRGEIKRGWNYCPECGFTFSNQIGFNIFSDKFFDQIFSRMRTQMKDMNKLVEKEFEVRDIRPLFKITPRGAAGFTIKITRTNDEKPRIDVKTFGGVDKEEVKEEVEEQLQEIGVKNPKPFWTFGKGKGNEEPKKIMEELQMIRAPKSTEEPKTKVSTTPIGVNVSVELPEVRDANKIEVKDLESSIEIKAISGDKAYFKILTKPSRFRLKSKRFEDCVLHLEFA